MDTSLPDYFPGNVIVTYGESSDKSEKGWYFRIPDEECSDAYGPFKSRDMAVIQCHGELEKRGMI